VLGSARYAQWVREVIDDLHFGRTDDHPAQSESGQMV
jgi:hypothetical protein